MTAPTPDQMRALAVVYARDLHAILTAHTAPQEHRDE